MADGWKVDGKPVDSTSSTDSSSGGSGDGWKVDGKPVTKTQSSYDLMGDFGNGVISGAASTVFHGGDLLRRGWNALTPKSMNVDRVINNPDVKSAITPPDSTAGKVGHGLEQAAEFFIPVPGTGKLKAAGQGAGILKRALFTGAKDALQSGTVAGVQSGGDPTTTIGSAVLGGAAGAVTGGLGAAWDKTAALTHDVTPERKAAAEFGKQEGVLVDPATRTGSPMLRNTKKFLSSGVNAGEAENITAGQDQAFDALGNRLVDRAGNPTGATGVTPRLDPDQVGQSGYDALTKSMQGHMANADQAYGGFRAATRMMPDVPVQVTSPGAPPSGILGPNGLPVTGPGVVTKNFKIPVDRSAVQSTLKPILDQWEQVLPVTEKNASRGLAAMRNLVNGDSVVEADTALKDLHALYDAQKLEPGQISRDLNQGLATKAMQSYRQATDQAISSVNPSLLQLVNQGRAATGQKYAVQGLMKKLGGRVDPGNAYAPPSLEPVKVYDNLTKAGDRGLATLRQFQSEAPAELPKVASTVLQGLLDRSSAVESESSFARGAGALNKWNALGPQTKQILYGPQLTGDLDNFFRLGKYLSENPNPSNTGMHVWMAARLMTILNHPMIAAKDTAFEYALGKYMFSDRGPLPYISQIAPGKMGVNPAAAMVGGAFRLATGIDPAGFQKQEQSQPQSGMMHFGSSDPETFPNGSPSNPYDAGAMGISSTQAQSRFTKTPISITNTDKTASDLQRALGGLGVKSTLKYDPSPTGVVGSYTPSTDQIKVGLSGSPTYSDLNNTIHHEDVHALLTKSGVKDLRPEIAPYGTNLVEKVLSMFHIPDEIAKAGFEKGNRAGNPTEEIPAYMAAFKPGELKDVTPEDRDRWLHLFLPKLPEATRKQLLRIIANHDAGMKK